MLIVLVTLIILIIVDEDYNAGPYTVTIDAGKNDVTFNISINNDNIHEQIENILISLLMDLHYPMVSLVGIMLLYL